MHLAQNPVLIEVWKDLWPRLQICGWETIEIYKTSSGAHVSVDDLSPGSDRSHLTMVERHYVYTKVTPESRISGIHKFASKLAMSKYIAR